MSGKFFHYESLAALRTAAGLVAVALAASVASASGSQTASLSFSERSSILVPVQKWAKEIENEKNADGASYKKVAYSRSLKKVDETTYHVAAHVNTAESARQLTEHYRLTISKASGSWQLTEKEIIDTRSMLVRSHGMACYSFERFAFDREGMKLSGTNGSICEEYTEGQVSRFAVQAADLAFTYKPPAHVETIQTGHDFYAMHELLAKDHSSQLSYKPAAFLFDCHRDVCEELIGSSVSGATRPPEEGRKAITYDSGEIPDWAKHFADKVEKELKKDAFYGFTIPDYPDNRYWSVFIPTELQDYDDGVWLSYNNWGTWEVRFGVTPQRWDMPNQLVGSIFGYYSVETTKVADAYELERRESWDTRWFDVYGVKGEVDLAMEDPEKVRGDVEFTLNLKQDMDNLPFFIISFSNRGPGGQDRPKPIVVNSIEVDGEEATWVQYGPIAGTVVLPKPMAAGSRVKVRMDWESRALLKLTHSYSYVPRIGWLPFVRFGDVIDEFEMTIRSPSQYDIIGLGHKVEERIEGQERVSHWKADNPCNFPTVIFGKYRSDVPKFEAKKSDGTVIKVRAHVDEATFGSWDVRETALRPIAEQAANAINLYTEISGLDYPFGELNLVNDPAGPLLYGQAPSSIIYLGQGVFRGEGFLAPYFLDATGIAKFLKSVVAHEVGHQWWGSRIANANDRNYWFVESLAEYFSAIFAEAVYGWKAYEDQVGEWRRNILSSNLKGNVQNSSTLFSGEWGGGLETSPYTAAVYNKGPYAFHMLRETFKADGTRGPEAADQRFFAFLKQFSQNLAEKREIVTLDIQKAAEQALGGVDENGNRFNVDLGWFFDQWIRGTGMPQYAFTYDVRPTEEGSYIIEGVIRQRVLLGNTDSVLAGTVYRGVVEVTVAGKGGPYKKRIVINEAETPVLLKVPVKPLEITLNDGGEMLAHDTLYNRNW